MTGQLIQLPPIQHDQLQATDYLHTINLNMTTPYEDNRSWLTRLAASNWLFLVILTSYTTGLTLGALLAQ